MGLWKSGLFDQIIGVDIEPQPDYPFDFVQGDVTDIKALVGNAFELPNKLVVLPDFVWASPPCQAFTSLKHVEFAGGRPMAEDKWNEKHKDFVAPTRELIAGHPWTCIENVRHAPVRADIKLEGGNVGIPYLKRHRIFEVSWDPQLQVKPFQIGKVLVTPYGMGSPASKKIRQRRRDLNLPVCTTTVEIQHSFGVYWTSNKKSLCEGIPPAYATYVINDAVAGGFANGTK